MADRRWDIDLLSDIPAGHGLRQTYDDLLPGSSSVDAGGVTVTVAGLDDIIRSKEWANRDKDRAALPELRELAKKKSPEADSDT